MTEPRYDNGKLAKWYYSRKRTISDGTDEYYLLNKREIDLEDGTIILGSNKLLDKLNELSDNNLRLRNDLIDHSALLSMLEDYKGLKIEDILWNLTGVESEEEFNELYKPYLEKAKKCWGFE